MSTISRGKKRVVGLAIAAALFSVSLALDSTTVAHAETPIHAAFNGHGPYAGKAFFFRGNQYVRYDWAQERVDEGYPLPITTWHLPGEFATGISAAIDGQGPYAGKAFFFRGNQYVRYDWAQERVDEGYPLPISTWHLPGEFATGIDAAFNGHGPYAGKAFFFRGNQYVRYDWAQEKVDEGYPLPISTWHLPGEFPTGIDAALDGQGPYTGKAFFFRGDQYVRYDWAQEKVDDGYPTLIVGGWPGIERLPPPLDTMTCQVFPSPYGPLRDTYCNGTVEDSPSPPYAPVEFYVNNFGANSKVDWSDPSCNKFSPTCMVWISRNTSETMTATVWHENYDGSYRRSEVSATATYSDNQ